jgi:uncharacterized membrane protein
MVLQKLAPGWPWRLAVLTPLGVYGFVYPFGIGLLLFGWMPPEAGWVGGCLLAAQGLAMAAWCGLNYGAARGLGAALIIAVVAWALEAFGVTTGAPYYGVPWANFATWFGASLILGAVLQALLRPAPGRPLRYAGLPPLLYAMSLLMFGLLNWSRGFVVPAALAIVLLPPVLWRLRACVSPRWAL